MRAVTFAVGVSIVLSYVLNDAILRGLGFPLAMVLVPLLDWRGIVIVTCGILLLALVTRRFWLAVALVGMTCILVSVTTILKLRFLGEPVLPTDIDYLRAPEFALSMVPWWAVPAAVMSVVLAVGIGLRLDRRSTMLAGWGASRAMRAGAAVVLGMLLVVGVTFNQPGNPLRFVYDHTGKWSPVNNVSNMAAAGFIGGFLSGMPMVPMKEPAGYSRSAMEQLHSTYARLAASTNADRDIVSRPNVVLVLGESVADPVGLKGVSLAEDPLADFRDLAATTGHGTTKAVAFGNGTSSMEYQALSGHAISLYNPPAASPYHAFVSDHPEYPSVVSMLADRGYGTMAIYPGSKRSYKRETVFESMGFDTFVDLDAMSHRDVIENGPWVSDDEVYDEVEDRLAASDDPAFVHVLTMQNHSPLTDDRYADGVEVTGPEGKDELMGQWARGLEHTSRALSEFLDRLSDSSEPTVVIYYGDHFPPGMRTDVPANGERAYETPFILWSNFKDRSAKGVDHGVLGPQYLTQTAFEDMGLAEPPMFALLERMRDEVGTPTTRGIIDRTGRIVAHEDLTADQKALLHDYELVQYDQSIGKRYAKDMWTITQ
jgi:phosphoglycerol transferase MdoB-like AlkP superfamily enzyme